LEIRITNNQQKIATLRRKIQLLTEREKIMEALYFSKQNVLAKGSISQNEVDSARIDYLLVEESLHDRKEDVSDSLGALKKLHM
jgi:hypothetical protein